MSKRGWREVLLPPQEHNHCDGGMRAVPDGLVSWSQDEDTDDVENAAHQAVGQCQEAPGDPSSPAQCGIG